jgi:hypothetical protein
MKFKIGDDTDKALCIALSVVKRTSLTHIDMSAFDTSGSSYTRCVSIKGYRVELDMKCDKPYEFRREVLTTIFGNRRRPVNNRLGWLAGLRRGADATANHDCCP